MFAGLSATIVSYIGGASHASLCRRVKDTISASLHKCFFTAVLGWVVYVWKCERKCGSADVLVLIALSASTMLIQFNYRKMPRKHHQTLKHKHLLIKWHNLSPHSYHNDLQIFNISSQGEPCAAALLFPTVKEMMGKLTKRKYTCN